MEMLVRSPDGKRIALAENGTLFLVNLGTRHRRKLLPENEWVPLAFSPDGTRQLVRKEPAEPDAPMDPGDLYSVGTDGADLQRLAIAVSEAVWFLPTKDVAHK